MEAESVHKTRVIGQIFQQHYQWLCTRLAYRTGCSDRAEDIAAETFLRVCTLAEPDAIREPRALLTTIAQRLMYEGWRRRDVEKAYLQGLAGDVEDVHPSPQEQMMLNERLLAIDRRLEGLAGQARAVFVHRQLEGMTYVQISERLGLSVGRVHQLMTVALQCCHCGLRE